MKNKLNKLATFIFILALFCSTLNFIPFVGMVSADLAPSVEWSHIYSAGLGDDAAWCVVETLDGGFALGGSTNSFGAGSDDFWLIKTDSEGVEEWNMTYGDSSFERALSLIQTSDGGYALIGYRINSTTYTSDVWFVKTDEYGSMSWNMTYGGAAGDHAYSVIETIDGYAIAGSTYSYGAGNYDVWLIKTDQYGVPQWNQTYGGTTSDEGYSMVMTAEGFAIAGSTRPVGKDYLNALVVRVASNGTLLDLYTYEINTNSTRAYSIVESADGFVLAGVSQNPDNPEIDTDFLLFKTTTTGEILWNQTYDNNVNEMPESLIETTDGGFVLAGYTGVSNTTLDAWVVKTDSAGNELWNQTYGEYLTIGRSIIQTNDGYYALAGHRSVGQGYYADAWLTLLRRARVHNLDTGVDYYSIQDAIDDYQTLDGHTIFVESGTYYENVEIIKSIILIGEDSSTTIIDGGGALDVLAIRSDNVSVSGFTVMDSYGEVGEGGGGLVVSGEVGNIQISDIIARNNNADCGVHLVPGSHDVNITNTIIMDNSRGGLLLHRTQNVTVSNNLVTNNIWDGVSLLNDSHNNTISGNTITNNGNGISFHNSSSYNAVYGNTITNCTNTGIRLSESSNNLVSGNTITNNNWGINLVNSQNNTLTDNYMTSNTYNFGVFGNLLEYYIHNIDTSNTVDGKDVYYLINQSSLTIDPENFPNIGFLALVNSTNIAVRDLTLTNNLEGILCVSLTDCTIENVSITDNFLGFTIVDNPPGTSATNNIMSGCSWGVFITNTTSGFSLHDNIISNNNYGIGILGPNNTFVENTIINNEYGVLVQNCSDNIFYHNNFIDNTVQANVTDGYVNTWDNGYPSGGNYWSDYTGVDLYSGPYQDETGSDVIGDTPYIIDLDNQDNYPLMPSLVLGSIYLESIAYGETLPSSDWLYKLTETATGNVTNFAVPPGNTSLILSDLTPGWYMLNLTSKFNYYTTGITINETAVEWETYETEILVDLEVLSGETTTVEFSNAFIPDAAWGKKVKEDDTSAPSMMTDSLPCLVAIPVQVTWDLEEPVDLVMGKATRILVNLTDLLEPVGSISPNDDVTMVTVSITSDSPDFAPMDVTLNGQEIADNNVVIFSPNPPITTGDYTITCTITADSTPPYSSALVTPVSVKETSELSLYYSHLYMEGEYGTEPLADYETMVANTSDFISATYPVPNVEVYSNEAGLAGTEEMSNYLGLLKDCQNIAAQAKLAFPESPNAIGVAIGPDLQSGGKYDNYFAYHGAVQGKKTAVGVSFGPGVKGVVVLDGYYSAAAHEIGHTFGLYYGVPEQYEIANPGIFCTGFRADENEWRTGYDFMGLSPYQTTANVWVNRDTTFDPLFGGLKTPGDPQILFVQGIIYQDDEGVVTLVELPTWYSMPYGIPDTVPEGDRFAIRFTLDDNTVVETSFFTEFLVHICPGIEVGENLPEDFSGFGDIPVNFAGFAFAVEYPEETATIEIVDTTLPPEEQVIATIDPETDVESVSPQFSGFLPPIKSDGSSSFKRRTVVPVKFQLQSAPGVFVTTAQPELWIAKMDDDGTTVIDDPVRATSATPYDLFRYDPLKNQYVFNLNTKGMSKGYWQLQVRFEDGTTETVRIRLR